MSGFATAIRTPTKQRRFSCLPVSLKDDSKQSPSTEDDDSSSARFKPFWTQRKVLVCFALYFIAVIAALEAILQLSNKHLGLSNVNINQHYLWVYGPTAIFTMIVALWARVDYRLRQMTPWFGVEEQHGNASKNLWKDYLTQTTPEIIWYSIKEGDYAVTLGSIVVTFITLLMVISTGLFALEPRLIELDNVPYQLTSQFNDSSIDDLSSALILDFMDRIDRKTLAYPFGLTPDTVYSTFVSDPDREDFGTLQSVVTDVVRSNVQCVPALLNITAWNTSISERSSLVTDNCTFTLLDLNDLFTNETEHRYFGYFTQDTDQYRHSCGAGPSPIGVMVGEIGPLESVDSQSNMTVGILRSNQYLCWPSIIQAAASVSLNKTMLSSGSFPNITIVPKLPIRHPIPTAKLNGGPGPDPISNISVAMAFSHLTGNSISGTLAGQKINTTLGDVLTPRLLQNAGARGLTIEDLLSSDVLADLASDFAQRAFVLYAYFGLRFTNAENINGTMIADENRLVVQSLPIRLMQGLSSAIILALLVIVIMYPTKRLRADPALLAGSLVMLNRNTSMRERFSGTGALDVHSMQRVTMSVQSGPDSSVQRPEIGDEPISERPQSQEISRRSGTLSSDAIQWWRPIVMMRRARIGISILVCLTIVALEVLLWCSQRSQGIATVSSIGSIHLAWSIPPAALMVAIAMYFRALSSQYKLFASYVQLRLEDMSARLLFQNHSSRTEPEAFFLSVSSAQWGTALVTFSVFLSAFLTIIMSGVWVASPVSAQQAIKGPAATWFNTTTTDDGTSGDSAWIANSLLTFNTSYPTWTYKDLVFPSMNVTTNFKADSVRGNVPALRTTLNCTLYTEAELSTKYYGAGHEDPRNNMHSYSMTIGFPVPGNCSTIVSTLILSVSQPDGYWVGYLEHPVETCPQINFYWGWQDVNSPVNTSSDGGPATFARLLSCSDAIEKVDTETTFILPDYSVDETHPPQTISAPEIFSTARITTPYSHFEFTNTILGTSGIGGLWSTVAQSCGISKNDLKDPNSADKITSGLKAVHGVARAQQYHAALRKNATSLPNAPQNLSVTLVQSNRWRLVQNAISTHVLCAVLGAMVICLVIASAVSSTNQVLPKNPGSIGAQISLLADSNILKDEALIQDIESSLQDRKALKRLDQHRFRMGWFENEDNEKMVWTINRVEPVD